MVFDTVVLVLMLSRTFRIYRQNGINAVTFVLIRDQVLFYGLTFTAGLANIVSILFELSKCCAKLLALVKIHFARKGQYHNPALLSPFTLAMVSISSSRILLNLRSLATEVAVASASGASKARRTQLFSPYSVTSPATPFSPVHQYQYPQLNAFNRDLEKDVEFELEKTIV